VTDTINPFLVETIDGAPTVTLKRDSLLGLVRTCGEVVGLTEAQSTDPQLKLFVDDDIVGHAKTPWHGNPCARVMNIVLTNAPPGEEWNASAPEGAGQRRYASVSFNNEGTVVTRWSAYTNTGLGTEDYVRSTALPTVRDAAAMDVNQVSAVIAALTAWIQAAPQTTAVTFSGDRVSNTQVVTARDSIGREVFTNNPHTTEGGDLSWCYGSGSSLNVLYTHEPRYARNYNGTYTTWHRPGGGRETRFRTNMTANAALDWVRNAPAL
jgi:hypothetical protein